MKKLVLLLLLVITSIRNYSQDTTLFLNTSMLEMTRQEIQLESNAGWLFKQGNDTSWASPQLDLAGWKPLKPNQISAAMADDNGRVEAWFRIKIKLDSSFSGLKLGFRVGRWAAVDLYVDGRKLKSFGNTGESSYAEHPAIFEAPTEADLMPDKVHVIALHLVDYLSPWHVHKLKSEVGDKATNQLIRLTGPNSMIQSVQFVQEISNYSTVWISVMGLLAVLFWLLYFQNADQQNLILIALCTSAGALNVCFIVLAESIGGISFMAYSLFYYAANLFGRLFVIMIPILLVNIFNRPMHAAFKVSLFIIGIFSVLDVFLLNHQLQLYIVSALIVVSGYYIFTSWKGLKGAQWYVVAGLFLSLFFTVMYSISYSSYQTVLFPYAYAYAYATGIYLSVPVFLMIYVATRFREIIADVRQQTAQVLQLSEEKKEQALLQKELLEKEVARQTIELRESLDHLKSTQSQLIQSEKMASLGELTAGIAHEIQNPLNFVNNFSEVNGELLAEMKDELNKGNIDDANAIANDAIENQQKILHHGKRADAIVKGMLQHSISSSGQKELTDINVLCDEYLRLSYHGLRAKDKSFNAKFETDFDSSLEKLNVVPQDIGRVVLNLINNAFYAVNEKQKLNIPGYESAVSVSTSKLGDKVEIRVKDNGNGIPASIKEKIFQPFFTTKPTGQGTGLGLSLSYDIVKAHGGELKVETKEGEGSEFTLVLPN